MVHTTFCWKTPKKGQNRVVFDCSARFSQTSINDHLLQGPDQLNSLIGILCRFRKERIAITCDVEKMFYNFLVDPNDRDYLRFLWPDKEGTVKEHRMTVHLFGATSLPAVATYGLRKPTADNSGKYPQAASFIQKGFYVDDGVTSVSDVEAAKKLIEVSIELRSRSNLRLHKFGSNNEVI